MKCPNCHQDHWENVDSARIKPQGMSVCLECGFISYPSKWKAKEEILKHYRSSYRQPPSHFNIFAGERKNHFHHVFLLELFDKWKAEGLENPRILEVGAAFGFTLQWFKQLFPKAEVHGTELTTSMRRVAANEFGIRLDEDIDETKKYDLIMSYKVLEHQLDPDVELRRYQKMLKPEGRMYISVPTWFDTMSNFGVHGFDLEYYYDPNHINVWTRNMFEGMLEANGFEIVKTDYVIYSSTYLCRAEDTFLNKFLPRKESVEKIKENLNKVKAAYMLFTENRFSEAMQIWPDYPTAHAQNAEMTRKNLTEKGWTWFRDNVLDKAIKDCPNSADALITATDFAMRAEQWTEAVNYAERALLAKPENPTSLHQLCNIMREKALRGKTPTEKLHYFKQAREVALHLRRVSSQHFKEATDLIFLFHAHIPFENEAPNENSDQSRLNPLPIEHDARHEASL